ncbi:MAG: hypothetical protein ABI550_02930 [Ignavibacteriaceae bacterium]
MAKSHHECEMKMMHKKKSCCKDESPHALVIKSLNDICCQTKIVDASLKDQFISLKSEIKVQDISIIILDGTPNTNKLSKTSKIIFSSDGSPPSFNNYLYLSNSILII